MVLPVIPALKSSKELQRAAKLKKNHDTEIANSKKFKDNKNEIAHKLRSELDKMVYIKLDKSRHKFRSNFKRDLAAQGRKIKRQAQKKLGYKSPYYFITKKARMPKR